MLSWPLTSPTASIDRTMPALPTADRFTKLATTAGQPVDYVPVFRRLVSDSLTPVSAFHRLAISDNSPASAACLFESVIGGEKVGRYSFLASEPFLQIKASGTQVTVSRRTEGDAWEAETSECPNPCLLYTSPSPRDS